MARIERVSMDMTIIEQPDGSHHVRIWSYSEKDWIEYPVVSVPDNISRSFSYNERKAVEHFRTLDMVKNWW